MSWWQTFFDDDYLRVWGGTVGPERTAQEADGLWRVLELAAEARVLDAPCGHGRLSRALAERGAIVVGVDQSRELLAAAEAARGGLGPERLRYRHHDLRQPLDEGVFDVALNIFSSLGYGGEDDDLAILTTLARALAPGGRLFIDSMHRDACVALIARGIRPASRLDDGTLVLEEPRFDVVAGRNETTWYWQGPSGGGQKSASIRLYTVTELVRLVERVGLRFVSAHRGCSPEPFSGQDPNLGGRVGILARRD